MDEATGTCRNCGAETFAGDRFCTSCGTPVSAPADTEAATADSSEPRPSAEVVQLFQARKMPPRPARELSEASGDVESMLADAERAWDHGDPAKSGRLLDQAVERFPGDYRPRAERGLWHFENEDWDQAVRDLEAAIDLEDEVEGHIWVYLGQSLFELGEAEKALACFDRVIADVDDYAAAYFYRGLARLSLGRDAEGLEDLGAAIRLDPADKDPLLARACFALAGEDFEAARDDLLKAHALEPEDPEVVFHLGRAQAGMGDAELAARSFARVVELDPDIPGLWREQGTALSGLGRLEEARESLNLALERDPADGQALIERGRLHVHRDDLTAAELDLRRAVRLAPESGAAQLLLGQVLHLVGKGPEAMAAFDRAAALGEDEDAILAGRAWIWLESDDVESAEEAFRELVETDPEEVDYRLGLGHALTLQKHGLVPWGEGLEVFDGILEDEPDNALAYAGRAVCHYLLMEPALAIADSDEALSRDPEIDKLDTLRAASFIELGEIDKAKQAVARAWSRLSGADDDEMAEALVVRARLRLAEGEPEAAGEDVRHALALDPGDDMAHYVEGQVRAAGGDHLGAVLSYNAALEIDPLYPPFLVARGRAYRRHGKPLLALEDLQKALELLSAQEVAAQLQDAVEGEIEALESSL